MYENAVEWFFDKLDRINYKTKYVVDKPEQQTTKEEELSKDEYDKQST